MATCKLKGTKCADALSRCDYSSPESLARGGWLWLAVDPEHGAEDVIVVGHDAESATVAARKYWGPSPRRTPVVTQIVV